MDGHGRNPAKPAGKGVRTKNPTSKPSTGRANKKAEVIALMKRAKGATLAESMAVMERQAHAVRGFVSILSSRAGRRSTRPRTPFLGHPASAKLI
jgi:hypothetical protein